MGHFRCVEQRRLPVTDHRSPPPQPEGCLVKRYPSSQKGGTLIDERVTDLETHERLLRCGGYRPVGCPRCGQFVHVHDYRPRLLLGDPAEALLVARFWCPDCEAVWQVLPAFVARCLWRSWRVVEEAVAQPDATKGRESPVVDAVVPERTRRRWQGRLLSSAALLVAVLATSEGPEFSHVAKKARLEIDRAELVSEYAAHARPPPGERLAQPAAVVHRLAPGVRVM